MKSLFLILLILSPATSALTNLDLSCSRKIEANEVDQFDIYFVKFQRATYSLSTINLKNIERLTTKNPIEALNIIRISKQGSRSQFDDIIEVERENNSAEKFFRFIFDSGVANLLVAESEEEVFMERDYGSLKIYHCQFQD